MPSLSEHYLLTFGHQNTLWHQEGSSDSAVQSSKMSSKMLQIKFKRFSFLLHSKSLFHGRMSRLELRLNPEHDGGDWLQSKHQSASLNLSHPLTIWLKAEQGWHQQPTSTKSWTCAPLLEKPPNSRARQWYVDMFSLRSDLPEIHQQQEPRT